MRTGAPASARVLRARSSRCDIVASETRKARAICPTVRPQTARSVSATCASRASAGWQQAKTRLSSSSSACWSAPPPSGASLWAVAVPAAVALAGRRGRAVGAGRRVGDREQGQLALADPVPAEPVEGLAAGGGGQPAARVGGHAVARPVLDRLDERVLHGVLGQAEVPGPRGQRGPDPGRLLPVCALERFRGRLHGPSLPRRVPCPGVRQSLGLLRVGATTRARAVTGGGVISAGGGIYARRYDRFSACGAYGAAGD